MLSDLLNGNHGPFRDVSTWNVGQVVDFSFTFSSAEVFNNDVSQWVSLVVTAPCTVIGSHPLLTEISKHRIYPRPTQYNACSQMLGLSIGMYRTGKYRASAPWYVHWFARSLVCVIMSYRLLTTVGGHVQRRNSFQPESLHLAGLAVAWN